MRSCLILFLLLFHAFLTRAQYCFTHINVVDVEKGSIIRNQTVCIEGNRIKSISGSPIEDREGEVYDCTGKYLMPGLWDMHIHDAGDDSSNRFCYVPLFIANGVTGIRDMWGSKEMLLLKSDIGAGSFIGPRMVIGSPIIDGEHSLFRSTAKALTEAQGRQLVDSFYNAGFDFIKIYSLLRAPVYRAIAAECKKKKIPLEGHLPIEIGLEEAVYAGQRSFEHSFNVNRYLTGRETDGITWSHHYLDTVRTTQNVEFMIHGEPLKVTEDDFHLPRATLNNMIQNRVAVVPTLTLAWGRSMDEAFMTRQTKGLAYLPAGLLRYWGKEPPAFPKEFIQTFGAAAKYLMNSGVLILAGTDVNNPFCVPGFGLHQELINLHQAGLTNLQVIQTATLNPAKFLYQERDLGTVEVGKLADLLVLDDDPLLDVANTQKINAVIVNGKYISKERIAEMLKDERKRFGN